MAMDVIDFEIHGDDMQFVEIELDPGEAAVGAVSSSSTARWRTGTQQSCLRVQPP